MKKRHLQTHRRTCLTNRWTIQNHKKKQKIEWVGFDCCSLSKLHSKLPTSTRHNGSSWIAPGHYFFPALTPYTVICLRLHIHCPKAAQKHLKTTKTRKYRQRAVRSADTDFSWAINNDWELTWTYNLFRKIITQPVLVLWLCGSQGWAEVKKSAGAAECSLSAVWRVKTTLKYFRNLTVDHERNRLCGK